MVDEVTPMDTEEDVPEMDYPFDEGIQEKILPMISALAVFAAIDMPADSIPENANELVQWLTVLSQCAEEEMKTNPEQVRPAIVAYNSVVESTDSETAEVLYVAVNFAMAKWHQGKVSVIEPILSMTITLTEECRHTAVFFKKEAEKIENLFTLGSHPDGTDEFYLDPDAKQMVRQSRNAGHLMSAMMDALQRFFSGDDPVPSLLLSSWSRDIEQMAGSDQIEVKVVRSETKQYDLANMPAQGGSC